MRFRDFEDRAAEFFGIEPGGEARDFAAALEADGLTLRGVDPDDRDFWIAASDSIDAFVEAPELERYPLDPYFPHDAYLDPDIEWEMTAESEEGYGEQ